MLIREIMEDLKEKFEEAESILFDYGFRETDMTEHLYHDADLTAIVSKDRVKIFDGLVKEGEPLDSSKCLGVIVKEGGEIVGGIRVRT